MKPQMKLVPDDPHISWAPERTEKSGVAASVRGISKRFKKTPVLDDVSFDVAEGEIAGAAWRIRQREDNHSSHHAGLEHPIAGRESLHGKDVTELPARERGVGVIFQAYALFPRMTVEKNIAYGLKIRHRPSKERRRNVDRLIKVCSWKAHRKKYPWQLSGGQQQRVANRAHTCLQASSAAVR
jgi:ABC-type Fe3+/spermidine/putrescine transport system ATPase subunit